MKTKEQPQGIHNGDKSNTPNTCATPKDPSRKTKAQRKLAKRISSFEDVKSPRHLYVKPGSLSGRK